MGQYLPEINGNLDNIVQDVKCDYDKYCKFAHLATFPDMAQEPVIELDSSGLINYMNKAARNILPEFKAGQAYNEDHPFFKGLSNIIDGLKNNSHNSTNRKLALNNIPFKQNIFYVPELDTVRIVTYDLTEEKQMLESAKENLERFQTLFNGIQDAIFVINPIPDLLNGRIIEVNDAASEMLNYSRFEFLQLKTEDLFSPTIPDFPYFQIKKR
ncbi:MAG TPA: PAS domain-containing protein, partial [Candidatus Atribacteria bacterium]|nr:PAS domain-containing protein [Candidatus Atribacteria bacterium]